MIGKSFCGPSLSPWPPSCDCVYILLELALCHLLDFSLMTVCINLQVTLLVVYLRHDYSIAFREFSSYRKLACKSHSKMHTRRLSKAGFYSNGASILEGLYATVTFKYCAYIQMQAALCKFSALHRTHSARSPVLKPQLLFKCCFYSSAACMPQWRSKIVLVFKRRLVFICGIYTRVYGLLNLFLILPFVCPCSPGVSPVIILWMLWRCHGKAWLLVGQGIVITWQPCHLVNCAVCPLQAV